MILGMPLEIKRMNQMKLIFCDGTHGESIRTRVDMIVKESYVESKAAPAVSTVRNTRPLEAVAADSVQNTAPVVAIARSRKENGLAARFTLKDSTEVPTIIEIT